MADATHLETLPATANDAPASPGGHATCEACGAPIDAADAFCTACGTPHEPVLAVGDDAAGEVVEAQAVAVDEAAQRHFRCEMCGAEVATDPSHRSYVCAFCDSTYVVEFPASENPRQPPEFVIGFGITKDQARDKFREWIRQNEWYRPSDLASKKVADKLKGIYLPFWSFSMLAASKWGASIGEYWYTTETYTTRVNGKTVTKTRRVRHTEWWPLSGGHHRYYSGYLVSGSKGLPQSEADRIKPFHLPALKRYQPYFLAGWLNEEYSIAREEALERCKQEFYQWEQQNVAAFMPGDTHRGLEVQTWFSQENSDLILLPIYLLSYRYEDKLYRFMINGQTGKIYGVKPISRQRIAIAVAAGLGLVALVVLLMMLFGAFAG